MEGRKIMAKRKKVNLEDWNGPVWIEYLNGTSVVVMMDDENTHKEVEAILRENTGAKAYVAEEEQIYDDSDFYILERALIDDLERLGLEQIAEQLNLEENKSWKKVRAAWNNFLKENGSINKFYHIVPSIELEGPLEGEKNENQ